MADITKCTGLYRSPSGDKNCPYAKACYRYTAKASMLQSYMPHGPYSSTDPRGCIDFFMDRFNSNEAMLTAVVFARYISLIILSNISKIEYDEARYAVLKMYHTSLKKTEI